MYEFDASTVIGFVTAVWAVIQGVLSFDPNAYFAVLADDNGGKIALAALFVSTLSLSVGQSVVLFANRVRRRRFLFSLLLSAVLLVVGVFIWAAAVWLLAGTLFGSRQPFSTVFIVVALSYAPLVYGFLALLPYLGNIIYAALRIWIMLVLLLAVQALFGLALWEAVLCSLLGWMVLELIVRIPALTAVEQWLWRITSGKDELTGTEDLVAEFIQSVRQSAEAWEEEGS